MRPVKATVGEGGILVLSPEIQQAIGAHDGDTVLMRVVDGELHVYTLENATRQARELVRKYVPEGRSLVDELIADRRAEAERE